MWTIFRVQKPGSGRKQMNASTLGVREFLGLQCGARSLRSKSLCLQGVCEDVCDFAIRMLAPLKFLQLAIGYFSIIDAIIKVV